MQKYKKKSSNFVNFATKLKNFNKNSLENLHICVLFCTFAQNSITP